MVAISAVWMAPYWVGSKVVMVDKTADLKGDRMVDWSALKDNIDSLSPPLRKNCRSKVLQS